MSTKEEHKKVTAEVSKECWKALKVLAVQKEISLQQVVQDILEKNMQRKVKQLEVHEE
jgi:predicted HicB family RNase H-like nuclease